jgi:hypothetical protein
MNNLVLTAQHYKLPGLRELIKQTKQKSESMDFVQTLLREMFEDDSADTCAVKFPLMSMGGRAEGLACADLGARTPIGVSGNFLSFFSPTLLKSQKGLL